jgi:hypothetical protein
MIIISNNVYDIIEQYEDCLVNEYSKTKERAKEKKDLMIQAIYSNLNGIITHRPLPYKELGSEKNCLLYVYKDPKSKIQWGFAYKRFDAGNVIVYYMKNLKLVKESNI